jgi:hypothetical protein
MRAVGEARTYTLTEIDTFIELLTERVTSCRCQDDLAAIERWKRRRADLVLALIPQQNLLGGQDAGR